MATDDLQLTQVPSVEVGMLVRRPPGDVFQALVDPDITTRFWFTKSSGKVVSGASLQWDWEMYGVSAKVSVKDVDENRRIAFDWGDDEETTTVEFRFTPSGTTPPTCGSPRPGSAAMAMRSSPASPAPPADSPSRCAR